VILERRREGNVEVLTLNRPEAGNALSPELLADLGLKEACQRQPALLGGINVMDGKLTHQAVADAHGLPFQPPPV